MRVVSYRPRSIAGSILLVATLAVSACTGSGDGHGSGNDGSGPGGDPSGAPTQPDHAAPDELDVTLYVEDYGGIDRTAEPVRSGVPVPRSVGITDLDGFVVVDDGGSVVPAQFEVTSRWGGEPADASKPIKWILVSFLADVEAGSARTYRLQSSSMAQGEPAGGDSIVTTDDASKIVVDTGAARFTVSKTKFNLFDQVALADGTTVTASSPSGGIYVQTADGARFLASSGVTEVSVEEEGPVHAVVVARGKHENAAGAARLDYTVRMHFWKGRGDSLVAYTFTDRDLASIRSFTAVDEVGIDVPASVGGNAQFFIGSEDSTAKGALTAEAWQRQTGNLSAAMVSDFDPGNASTLHWSNGGLASGAGGKAPGWIAASGDTAVVTAALRWYWQQYPKKLRVAPGLLGVELWPSEDVDMRVYAAAQKTHEVLFGFHAKGTSAEEAGSAAAVRMSSPLLARCNPGWYAKTQVWNRIGVADQEAYSDENRQVVEAFYANLLGEEYPTTFVDRAFDQGGAGHAYSMWDFGDGREHKWSNLAYDTPRSLMIHWAMTGDRALLETSFQTLQHLRDVDIEHSPIDTRAGIRGNRGVTKPWLGRTRYNPSEGPQSHDLGFEGRTGYGFEHSKGQSFADHWFLTGDRMSKEVLAETYHYYEQLRVDAESGFLLEGGSTRTLGHMLLILLGYYDAYGTDEAKGRIEYVVSYLNDWQRMTSPRDPNGWMWTGVDNDTTALFQNGVTAEALILYETNFPDGIPVRQNIVDAARWTIDRDNGLLEEGPGGLYFNSWVNDNYGITHATVLDPMIGPMLGYAYAATGEQEFRDVAVEVLLNSLSQDSSTPYIKAFTQQTRLVPAFFHWLQKPEAQAEAGSSGFAP